MTNDDDEDLKPFDLTDDHSDLGTRKPVYALSFHLCVYIDFLYTLLTRVYIYPMRSDSDTRSLRAT